MKTLHFIKQNKTKKKPLSEGRKQVSTTSLLHQLQSTGGKRVTGHRAHNRWTCINALPVAYTTTMTSCPEADPKHLEPLNEQTRVFNPTTVTEFPFPQLNFRRGKPETLNIVIKIGRSFYWQEYKPTHFSSRLS